MELPERAMESGTVTTKQEASSEGRRPLTEGIQREKHGVSPAWPYRNRRRRRVPRPPPPERTVTVDDAVASALDIGPDASAAEHTIDITTYRPGVA
jgi:hypothetical protein